MKVGNVKIEKDKVLVETVEIDSNSDYYMDPNERYALPMPMAQNVSKMDTRNSEKTDWKKRDCPSCEEECWESEEHREMEGKFKNMVLVCTRCALQRKF